MKKRSVIKDVRFMLGFIWSQSKSLFYLRIFIIIIESLQLMLGTIYIKLIIDALMGANDIKEVFKLIIVLQGLSFIIFAIVNVIGKRIIPRKQYKIKNYLQNLFIKKAMMQDLQCYENYEFYDNYTKAIRYADSKAIDVLNIILQLFSSILSTVLLLTLISSLDIILLVFVIVTIIITLIDQAKSNRCSHELYEAEQSIDRRSEYLKKIAHHRQYAKEVRIFNMHKFIINKLNNTFNDKYKLFVKSNRKYWNIKIIVSIINTLIIVPFILGYIAYNTFEGDFSIGDFSLLFASIFTIATHISSILNTWSQLNFESEFYISHLRQVLDYKPQIEMTGTIDIDANVLHKIEFKNVTFTYPEHSDKVLDNVSFILEKGKKLAIVGKNGMGKSTIIKLLLRLYDVTSGEILIDEKNIKLYKVEQLRKTFSIILQDFNVYAFTVAENIILSEDSDKKNQIIQESLEFAGLSDKIKKQKRLEQSYITREFDEQGIEFSGGESQKLAIARAYANAASVLIFDEANSSLDPIAEYELNNKIMKELFEKSAIFVSHRLSTTIFADKIIMLENGNIVEEGTHEELMKLNKLYALMFSKQAEAYRINKEIKNYE